MKFKVGDMIFSDYYNMWGFVSKLDLSQINKTRLIYITWFRTGIQSKYPIGSYPYTTFKKVEDIK